MAFQGAFQGRRRTTCVNRRPWKEGHRTILFFESMNGPARFAPRCGFLYALTFYEEEEEWRLDATNA